MKQKNTICKDGNIETHSPAEAHEVFDVTGAGDTVIATLSVALAAGINVYQSAWLANRAAGRVVAHMETTPVKIGDLQKWLEDHKEKY